MNTINNWKRWSGDRTLNFVLEYKKQTCLWDVNNKYYRDRLARNFALESIAKSISDNGGGNSNGGDSVLDIAAVRKKLRIIRSTYWNEHRKIEKYKNQGKIFKSKIIWFDVADSFLKNVINWGEKITKVCTEKDSCSSLLILKSENNNNVDSVDEIFDNTNVQIKLEPTSENQLEKKIPKKSISKKKRKKVNLSVAVKNLQKIASSSIEDQFDLFGKYIASQLRELPIQDALLSKEKITNLLIQQRLNAIGHPLSQKISKLENSLQQDNK